MFTSFFLVRIVVTREKERNEETINGLQHDLSSVTSKLAALREEFERTLSAHHNERYHSSSIYLLFEVVTQSCREETAKTLVQVEASKQQLTHTLEELIEDYQWAQDQQKQTKDQVQALEEKLTQITAAKAMLDVQLAESRELRQQERGEYWQKVAEEAQQSCAILKADKTTLQKRLEEQELAFQHNISELQARLMALNDTESSPQSSEGIGKSESHVPSPNETGTQDSHPDLPPISPIRPLDWYLLKSFGVNVLRQRGRESSSCKPQSNTQTFTNNGVSTITNTTPMGHLGLVQWLLQQQQSQEDPSSS